MITDRGIWTSMDETQTHLFDEPLCTTIFDMFGKSRIVDIGCGNGAYTKYILDHGGHCVGYDGSPLTPEISEGLCSIMDFSEPVNIGTYDVVLTLEVGEHIPKKYEQVFIDNICKAAIHYIILSWAVKNQPGTGHVNCQNNDYVIKEMKKRGWKLDEETTEILRKASTLRWFANTLMVFSHA